MEAVQQRCLDLETRVGLCVRKGHMLFARARARALAAMRILTAALRPAAMWQLSSAPKEKEEDERTRGARRGGRRGDRGELSALIHVRSRRHVRRHIRLFMRERYTSPPSRRMASRRMACSLVYIGPQTWSCCQFSLVEDHPAHRRGCARHFRTSG